MAAKNPTAVTNVNRRQVLTRCRTSYGGVHTPPGRGVVISVSCCVKTDSELVALEGVRVVVVISVPRVGTP